MSTFNLRRDVPYSNDPMDEIATALRVLLSLVAELQTAATRGLPPGFRWDVTRNADGSATLAVVDTTRNTSLNVGSF